MHILQSLRHLFSMIFYLRYRALKSTELFTSDDVSIDILSFCTIPMINQTNAVSRMAPLLSFHAHLMLMAMPNRIAWSG